MLVFRYQLDLFKGATFLWVLLLMHLFQNYSSAMYLYLFLHGSYGICWVIKDFWFPDTRVLQKGSLGSNAVLFLLLTSYWIIPVPLAAGYGVNSPSTARMIFLVVMYLVGVFLMMGADYQKTITLRRRKGTILSIQAWFLMVFLNTVETRTIWEKSLYTVHSFYAPGILLVFLFFILLEDSYSQWTSMLKRNYLMRRRQGGRITEKTATFYSQKYFRL